MIERDAGVPAERRVGIHLGDVVEEADGELMGDGINIAARIEGIAEPGAICLSDDAYRQVKVRLELAARDFGAKELKNIADPIRVFSLDGNVVLSWAKDITSACGEVVAKGIRTSAARALSPDTRAASDSGRLKNEGTPPHRRLRPPTLCFPSVQPTDLPKRPRHYGDGCPLRCIGAGRLASQQVEEDLRTKPAHVGVTLASAGGGRNSSIRRSPARLSSWASGSWSSGQRSASRFKL
jgi:Adenylate and Guanylate cyclase catalytic domain